MARADIASRILSVSQLTGGINIQPNKKLGRVVELPRYFILMEWKVVNIDFQDVGKSRDRELKAREPVPASFENQIHHSFRTKMVAKHFY